MSACSEKFDEGYDFFSKNAGGVLGDIEGGNFGMSRAEYVDAVKDSISKLEKDINSLKGMKTPTKMLAGNAAEFWHGDTFNINAALNKSANKAYVDQSHDLGSVDISTNFGKKFGLKYYANGAESAKQQAKSIFERFEEYKAKGGKDSLNKFLADRNYDSDAVLNDPLYSGQIRVIPRDQMVEATKWLKQMIAKEGARRPEQVKRYQETLDLLRDRLSDNEGNESIPLSKTDAEKLAGLGKAGKFNAEDWGISAPDVLTAEMVIKESLNTGVNAAVISLVLKAGPEIYKLLDYLIKNGEIEESQLKKVGFAALTGGAEGFFCGGVASAITACCKSGILGETFKEISPGLVGTVTAITINTLEDAFDVARGKKTLDL